MHLARTGRSNRRAQTQPQQAARQVAHPNERAFGVDWAPVKHPKLGFCVTHSGATTLYAASIWLLREHGTAEVTLYVDSQAPNKVSGFMIKAE